MAWRRPGTLRASVQLPPEESVAPRRRQPSLARDAPADVNRGAEPVIRQNLAIPPDITVVDIVVDEDASERDKDAAIDAWNKTVMSNVSYGTGGNRFKCVVCGQSVSPAMNFGRWKCWREIKDVRYSDSRNTYFVRADHLSNYSMPKAFYETSLAVDADALDRIYRIAPQTAPLSAAVIQQSASASVVDRVTAPRKSIARFDSWTKKRMRVMYSAYTKARGDREAQLTRDLGVNFTVVSKPMDGTTAATSLHVSPLVVT